jgi:hypothetical protein
VLAAAASSPFPGQQKAAAAPDGIPNRARAAARTNDETTHPPDAPMHPRGPGQLVSPRVVPATTHNHHAKRDMSLRNRSALTIFLDWACAHRVTLSHVPGRRPRPPFRRQSYRQRGHASTISRSVCGNGRLRISCVIRRPPEKARGMNISARGRHLPHSHGNVQRGDDGRAPRSHLAVARERLKVLVCSYARRCVRGTDCPLAAIQMDAANDDDSDKVEALLRERGGGKRAMQSSLR